MIVFRKGVCSRLRLLQGFSPLLIAVLGCSPNPETLTIATCWSAADREEIERGFHAWHSRGRAGSDRETPPSVRWVVLSPGDDSARLVGRRDRPDVLLGGVEGTYRRLARNGELAQAREGGPLWVAARRADLGLLMSLRPAPGARRDEPAGPGPPAPPARPRLTAFDDPRRDPIALAWGRSQLESASSWSEGYAGLVRHAGSSRPPGWRTGAAVAALERGAVEQTPSVAPRGPRRDGLAFLPDGEPEGREWVEGVAALRGARNSGPAASFLRFMEEIRPPARVLLEAPAETDSLLAELLGSTLVDARDELAAAWAALERTGHRERSERWMTEPPPWPPASIERILERGTNAMALLETLAGQLVTDARTRAGLLRSWLAPRRLIDGRLLEAIAGENAGRLGREPRFRAWLRGEWTAWARQRYRRVARLAEGAAA